MNLGLACFNLLSAFPMDGGRALRALLSIRMSQAEATASAVRLGKTLAVVFAVLGLLYNPMLVIIAVFVWASATAEASAMQFKPLAAGVPVSQAMVTAFRILAPEDPLALPMRHSLHSFQHDFPVCREGRLVGLLIHPRLLEVLTREGEGATVGAAMEAPTASAAPEELLSDVLPRLHNSSMAWGSVISTRS